MFLKYFLSINIRTLLLLFFVDFIFISASSLRPLLPAPFPLQPPAVFSNCVMLFVRLTIVCFTNCLRPFSWKFGQVSHTLEICLLEQKAFSTLQRESRCVQGERVGRGEEFQSVGRAVTGFPPPPALPIPLRFTLVVQEKATLSGRGDRLASLLAGGGGHWSLQTTTVDSRELQLWRW